MRKSILAIFVLMSLLCTADSVYTNQTDIVSTNSAEPLYITHYITNYVFTISNITDVVTKETTNVVHHYENFNYNHYNTYYTTQIITNDIVNLTNITTTIEYINITTNTYSTNFTINVTYETNITVNVETNVNVYVDTLDYSTNINVYIDTLDYSTNIIEVVSNMTVTTDVHIHEHTNLEINLTETYNTNFIAYYTLTNLEYWAEQAISDTSVRAYVATQTIIAAYMVNQMAARFPIGYSTNRHAYVDLEGTTYNNIQVLSVDNSNGFLEITGSSTISPAYDVSYSITASGYFASGNVGFVLSHCSQTPYGMDIVYVPTNSVLGSSGSGGRIGMKPCYLHWMSGRLYLLFKYKPVSSSEWKDLETYVPSYSWPDFISTKKYFANISGYSGNLQIQSIGTRSSKLYVPAFPSIFEWSIMGRIATEDNVNIP